MANLAIVPYEPALYEPYAAFARRVWGPDCYQASRKYLGWLYRTGRSPAPRPDDFLLARVESRVVGCIHKMRLVWKYGGELVEVPALHNWVVDEEFRSGVGLMLLTKAIRSDAHTFISSAAGDLATVYRKLKCQEVQASWYRRILRPVRGALRVGIHRALDVSPRIDLPARFERAARGSDSFGKLHVTMSPTAAQIARMVSTLQNTAGSAAKPHWTPDTLRWRFFDPDGPRHVFLGARDSDDFLLVTVAPHRGLAVARLVEAHVATDVGAKRLLTEGARFLKRIGAHLLLAYTADPRTNDRLRSARWTPLPQAQPSFLHHVPRQRVFDAVAFHASAADFGFEAIGGDGDTTEAPRTRRAAQRLASGGRFVASFRPPWTFRQR